LQCFVESINPASDGTKIMHILEIETQPNLEARLTIGCCQYCTAHFAEKQGFYIMETKPNTAGCLWLLWVETVIQPQKTDALAE
jgi:hypothetical protein